MKLTRPIAIAALLFCAGLAHADIVITTNTTIAPGDPVYQNQDIVVRGCTVTINGAHTFASLTIEGDDNVGSHGVVTHDANFSAGVNGMFLTITGNLTIQGPLGKLPASRIDVTGRGFPIGQGPGAGPNQGGGSTMYWPQGGSYGGAGALGSPGGTTFRNYDRVEPAPCYGSYIEPIDFGSGSGYCTLGPPGNPFLQGSPGAGAVRLVVGGTAAIDGLIIADGGGAYTSNWWAGGSGGSIWITADQFTGAGALRASGGPSGSGGAGGAGGGGRIAIHANTNSFTGTVFACGMAPTEFEFIGGAGGPGTVFYRITGQNDTLIFDNADTPPTLSVGSADFVGSHTFDEDVILRNRAKVNARRGTGALHLTFNGSLSIDSSSQLGANDAGPRPSPVGAGGFAHPFNPTPGAGGGGHGGTGAPGNGWVSGVPGAPGASHGDPNNPIISFGGSGGNSPLSMGHRGGGAFHLIANGPFILNGAVSADATPSGGLGGGGAGGSIWIEAPAISGSGIIAARGGPGTSPNAGAGGGGRIRIDTCETLGIPAGSISVIGGGGTAQPGTIVTGSLAAPSASPFAADPFIPHHTVVLTASATGDALSYQWRRDGVDLLDGGRYSGTQTATLTITDATCVDAGNYDFVVTNTCGSDTSNSVYLHSTTDWDANGVINSADVGEFINAWFVDQLKGTAVTDIDGNGISNSADVGEFINFWFEETLACG